MKKRSMGTPTLEYKLSVREEVANALTHGVMGIVFLLATPFAIAYTVRPLDGPAWREGISVAIFCLCLVLMFSASAIYHALPAQSRFKPIWNRLDHMAIFLAIAGSYTPIALIVIGGRLGWLIVALEWTLVLVGLVFKGVNFRKTKLTWVMTIALYLIMGWAVFLCFPIYMSRAQPANFWLILSGGICYTGGILFFALPFRYSHVIWHGFVMAGALCHFIGIIFFIH